MGMYNTDEVRSVFNFTNPRILKHYLIFKKYVLRNV